MFKSVIFGLSVLLSTQVFAISAGDVAPNFSLPSLANGKLQSLKQYRGKVVYLDFWASWCGPCRQSLPMLNDLYSELKRKGFEVVAVNLDENTADAKAFLNEFPVQYPVLLDPKGSVPSKYELPGMPTSYIIDKQGNIEQVHIGFKPKDMPEIRAHVIKLLKQK